MHPRPLILFLALLRGSASFIAPSPSPSSFPIAKAGATHVRALINLNLHRGQHHAAVTDSIVDDQSNTLLPRRSFWNRSLSTLVGLYTLSRISPISASYAAESSAPKMETYNDIDYGFHLSIPTSWENTEQKLSGRRKALFFTDPTTKDADSGTIETFGFVAYTPVRDDFTSLASFGSVENVAQMTILPKGDLAGQSDDSKMVSAISKNNAYYFDYIATPVVPVEAGESSSSSGALTKKLKPQHFRTIFTLLPLKNSAGMTLVTITLQTSEEKYGTVRGLFDNIIDSFGKN